MFQLFLSCDHGLVDHVLYCDGILGVEDITHPLLVQVVPVLLIGEVFQHRWFLSGKLQEVLDGQAIYLRYSRYFDTGPLNILRGQHLVILHLWYPG